MGSYYCGCPHHVITNGATHLSVHQLYKKKNIFSKKQHHKKLTGKTLPEVTQPKCPITVFYSPPLGSFCTDSWGRPVNERSTLGNSLTMYKSNYLTLT